MYVSTFDSLKGQSEGSLKKPEGTLLWSITSKPWLLSERMMLCKPQPCVCQHLVGEPAMTDVFSLFTLYPLGFEQHKSYLEPSCTLHTGKQRNTFLHFLSRTIPLGSWYFLFFNMGASSQKNCSSNNMPPHTHDYSIAQQIQNGKLITFNFLFKKKNRTVPACSQLGGSPREYFRDDPETEGVLEASTVARAHKMLTMRQTFC